jgi:hypothetical protein
MNPPAENRDTPAATPDEFERHALSRLKAIQEADKPRGYAIRIGASNPPFDCKIFSPDYRSELPEDDPARQRGPLREYGTEASLRTMEAAHNACLQVLGISLPQSR